MALIGQLKNLKTLHIGDAEDITDAGLVKLEGLKNLKEIYLFRTHITTTGVKKLKDAIPGLKVHAPLKLP